MDQQLAERMFALTMRLVAHRCTLSFLYEFSLPGCFALLLSPEPVVVSRGLSRLESLWKLFVSMETERLSDADVQAALHVAWWPKLVQAQEWLLMLSEAEFKTVPSEVRTQVEMLFRGILSTYVAEEAMNLLRQRSDSNRKHQLAVRQRWHALVSDHLLQDHGRPPVPDVPTPVVDARALPDMVFKGVDNDFSLPADSLERLVSTDYTGRSAEVWNQQGYFTASMLALQ
eukprot:649575-Amphidinium_carterae.1